MNQQESRQGGQSIILVAVALVALVIFVAISVDLSDAYHHRRMAQNAADAAALAGAQELGRQLNGKTPSDSAIKATMNDFAERNDIEDTNGSPADAVNDNVEGWYLDKNKSRIRQVGAGTVPNNGIGVEAVAHILAPSFFGGIVGYDGYPLQAEAAVIFDVACTGEECMLPIAIHDLGFIDGTFTQTNQCLDLWDGAGAGNFGWLNWSLQSTAKMTFTYSCEDPILYSLGYTLGMTLPSDCSAPCLDINMDPRYCQRVNAVNIKVGDYVGGTPGVNNASFIRERLDYYINTGTKAKIVVYDDTRGKGGCATPSNKNGFQYRVAGFACFRLTGYRLSHGTGFVECDLTTGGWLDCSSSGAPLVAPSNTCADYPGACFDDKGLPCSYETGDFNRITGFLIPCIGGGEGHCKAVGNLLAPRLFK